MTGPIPCVVYASRSRAEDGGDEDKSTKSQTAEVLKRIEQEGGRAVIAEFAESGESGYHAERGAELEAAMTAAKAAAAEAGTAELWVFHSSRLSRGDGTKGRQSLNLIHATLLYEDVHIRSVSDDEFVSNPMLVGIASVQNNKYSADLGAHVARGKKSAVEGGKWPGGPAPDGYVIEKFIDASKRTVSRLVIDAEREPVVRLIFDWSEEGIGDPTIARRLNEAGHRTRKGKPWSRRLVQYIVTHPVYAGRVVRWGSGSRKGGQYVPLDSPEVFDGQHDPIIEPARWERINAARAGRDLMKDRGKTSSPADRGKRGGRPTSRYVLSKLAKCDRCGENMYSSTSPYRRKSDGGQRRRYICANYHGATAVCDQKPIDAERVDAAVVEYLDRLFVDIETWAEELARGADAKRSGLESALAAERDKAAKAERSDGKIRARYRKAADAGRDTEVDLALSVLDEIAKELEAAREQERAIQKQIDALDEQPTPTDSALDLFNELAEAVRGGDGSLRELNERLRAEFVEFRLDQLDGETVGVQPVLRPRDFDVAAAFRRASEQGDDWQPTPEEREHYEALEDASSPILAGKAPPALGLEVVGPKPDNHHA